MFLSMLIYTTYYSTSLMPRNLREQALLMCHLCAGSRQYSTVAGLCWCKCGPKAPCQQSLETPNQVQTQDCCTSARIVARGKKTPPQNTNIGPPAGIGAVRVCSLRVGRVSPVPYFLLVKFRPVSYAADRILIRPVPSQRESCKRLHSCIPPPFLLH